MIRLLLFAPCEKIITGEDKRTSLISVLEELTLRGVVTGTLPQNAGFPMKWQAISLWHRVESVNEPITMQVKVELFAPNGESTMFSMGEFPLSNDYSNFRNTFDFPVFPIAQTGVYKAVLTYRKSDVEDWIIAGEYPINIIHEIKEVVNENQVADRIGLENEQAVEPV